MGNGWSIAWTTLDCRYFTPQRRKRIYLVADFVGQSAPEILFEQESKRRFACEGRTQRVQNAIDAEGGTNGVKILDMTHANDVVRICDSGTVPTLLNRMGTGGNQIPLVFKENGE